jgi:hypothetical protein
MTKTGKIFNIALAENMTKIRGIIVININNGVNRLISYY